MFRSFVNRSLCSFCVFECVKLDAFSVSHGNCLEIPHSLLYSTLAQDLSAGKGAVKEEEQKREEEGRRREEKRGEKRGEEKRAEWRGRGRVDVLSQ